MQKENDNMNKEDMTNTIPSVQKALNKLISEELAAGLFYNGCLLAAGAITDESFARFFNETAVDELEDHMKHLKHWAISNGYSVPFKPKDYEKYAEKGIKQLNNLKSGKDINYYIDEAIKSEEDAIASYDEIMQDDNIPYDLYAIMQQNMYDEIDHLEGLKFLKYAFDADAYVNAY